MPDLPKQPSSSPAGSLDDRDRSNSFDEVITTGFDDHFAWPSSNDASISLNALGSIHELAFDDPAIVGSGLPDNGPSDPAFDHDASGVVELDVDPDTADYSRLSRPSASPPTLFTVAQSTVIHVPASEARRLLLAQLESSSKDDGSTSTASSWVITTPVSSDNAIASHRSDDSIEATQGKVVTPEEEEAFAANAPVLGPCSRVWVVPKASPLFLVPSNLAPSLTGSFRSQKSRKKRQSKMQGAIQKRKSAGQNTEQSKPRRRGPFQNEEMRVKTALTRELKSCVRCRMLRIRVCPPFFEDFSCQSQPY